MRTFDWIVVVVYLVWIVYDGLRRSRDINKVEGYFLASRSLPWWVAGMSLVFPDWPLMGGTLFPPLTELTSAHVLHRWVAVVVTTTGSAAKTYAATPPSMTPAYS